MAIKLEHTGLSVSNLDRSLEFYRDLIGLTFLRFIECPPEAGLGDVVKLPRCSARIAQLVSGDSVLELFEYFDPRGKPIPPEYTQADNGFTHIGFATDDIWGDYTKLTEHGVTFYDKPVEYRPGVWVVYFYGPDGETCELRQANV